MADGLSIPGVSDKYKTGDLVEALMEVERAPLKREQSRLESYKNQQEAWRAVNQRMSSLRESAKALYSFENPFSGRLASSTDEGAITARADRDADFGEFKVEVIRAASSDKFLSGEVDSNLKVPAGHHVYSVGDKTISFDWKGGKLSDYADSLTKRGAGSLKASLVNVSAGKKTLVIESLKTGEENRLVFGGDALEFAKDIGMIREVPPKTATMEFSSDSAQNVDAKTDGRVLGKEGTSFNQSTQTIAVEPGAGFVAALPSGTGEGFSMEFTFSLEDVPPESVAEESSVPDESATQQLSEAQLPLPGDVTYEGITIENNPLETTLPPQLDIQQNLAIGRTDVDQQGAQPEPEVAVAPPEPLPLHNNKASLFAIVDSQGNEIPIAEGCFSGNQDGSMTVAVNLKDYPDAASLVVRNESSGERLVLGLPVFTQQVDGVAFEPVNPAGVAADALIRYEGIEMRRASNEIDDVVPNVTLTVRGKSEHPVTVNIAPDTESAKDAVITFVGRYNRMLAEMNILSSDKPEIVSELDYLTDEERETANERLGMFQGDFSLSNAKSSLQRIVSSNYRFSDEATVTMLSQIGISTNASGGGGYNPSQMRGYLEVDEKKLDEALETNLAQVKSVFGYDSDGDLIIDDGVALLLDRQLTSWVQSGGIISSKTSVLETRIKTSNDSIAKLQTQLERKEAELKRKYANMEGTLNSLENQQSTMQNFANQNQGSNR